MGKTKNISTYISTSSKLGIFAVHFAVYLLYQYKKYISVQISTSGHPVKPRLKTDIRSYFESIQDINIMFNNALRYSIFPLDYLE